MFSFLIDKLDSVSKIVPFFIAVSFILSIFYNIVYFIICGVGISEIPLTIQDYFLSFQGWIFAILYIVIIFFTIILYCNSKNVENNTISNRKISLKHNIALWMAVVIIIILLQYNNNHIFMFYINLFSTSAFIIAICTHYFNFSQYIELLILIISTLLISISTIIFFFCISFSSREFSTIYIKNSIYDIIILRNLEQGIFGYESNGSLLFIFKNGDKIIYKHNSNIWDIKSDANCFFRVLCRHENKCK